MSASKILAWQWEGYPRYHRSRTNLKIHIVAVPVFLFADAWFFVSFFTLALPGIVLALALMGLSLFAQGRGHDLEELPPEPFNGPRDAIARILLEQSVTFPRFVLSGGWSRALKGVVA